MSLSPLLSREAMLHTLQKEEYGFLPQAPYELRWEEAPFKAGNFAAGKATLRRFTLTVSANGMEHSFPVSVCLPTKEGKHPFYVFPNFRPDVPDRYYPTEEIIDNGFAVLSFCYRDVTGDNEDMSDGLARLFCRESSPHRPGKIALWAWSAMRVLDLAQSLGKLDQNRAGICGHSRLGKTALLAGAMDERFSFVHSNDSGCSGAALSYGKSGERIADIIQTFPFWFCPHYGDYVQKDEQLPFDQHWLLASIAPRTLLVTSAKEDRWAHPENEFLACVAAREMKKEVPFPPIRSLWADQNTHYYCREGKHYFSREDWKVSMELRIKKGV